MKSRAEIYCELLNHLFENKLLIIGRSDALYGNPFELYNKLVKVQNDHITVLCNTFLLDKFEEIDVIIWNEKTQKFEVRK